MGIKHMMARRITEAEEEKEKGTRKNENELWFVSKKQVINTTVVEFEQRHNGICVWKSGTTVCLTSGASDIVSASNSFDYDIPCVKVDIKKLKAHGTSMDGKQLAQLMLLDKNIERIKKVRKDIKIISLLKYCLAWFLTSSA